MSSPRVPMCEDVLVRANEYCRWSGMRFGQLIINAVTQHIIESNAALRSAIPDTCPLVKEAIFYMENGALEQALMAYITKHTARHEAINRMAQDAVAAGLYFTEPAGRAEVDHGD